MMKSRLATLMLLMFITATVFSGCTQKQANRMLKKVAKDPDNISLRIDTAYALDKEERFAEALKQYDKAIELFNKDPKKNMKYENLLFNNRGQTLYKLERHDDALKDFERLLKTDKGKKDSRLASNIAHCYHGKKNYDRAAEWFQKALALNPKNDIAKKGYLILQQDLQKAELEESARLEQKVEKLIGDVKKKPDDADMRLELATGLDALERWDEALEQYEKIIEIQGDEVTDEVMDNKVRALYLLERYDEALDILNELVQQRPDDSILYSRVGSCLLANEDFDGARENCEKALEIDEKNPGALECMQMIEDALKEQKNAGKKKASDADASREEKQDKSD